MKKRILSLILCACLVLGIVPAVNVHAAPATYELYDSTNTDNFYTHSMNGSGSSSGAVTVNGEERTFATRYKLTKTLTITLGSAAAGTLTVVWRGNDRTVSVGGQSVEVTGNTVKCETITLNAGTGNHTITGASGDIYIWYIGFTPDGSSSGGDATCDHANLADEYFTAAKDASCTVDGNVAYYTCPVCDKYISADKTTVLESVTVAAGHSWDAGTVTAPTCTEAGYTTYTCTVVGCGVTEKRDETAATGHNFEEGECSVCHEPQPACSHTNATATSAKAATCKEEGNIAYSTCDSCGAYFDAEGNEIAENSVTLAVDPVNGHSWDEGTVETKATCQAEGVMSYICSLCGETKTETIAIDPDAHSWSKPVPVYDATCIIVGSGTQTCPCGAEQPAEIPAGHDYDPVTGKCNCTGGALEYCGALNNDKYVHNFTTAAADGDPKADLEDFFTITGAMKDKSEYSLVYNNQTLTEYLKMNNKNGFQISFTTLTDEAAVADGYDCGSGILILITESRTSSSGTATLTTLLVNGVEVGVPRDGILVLGVTAGTAYTITKETGENPLFYIEYVPGARLKASTDDGSGDNVITMTAEIIDADGNLVDQYTTLADALAAVTNGQTVCLLENNSEDVTVGGNLKEGESFKIHLHATYTGTISKADDNIDLDGPKDSVYTVTRTAPAAEHECTDENGDGKCDGCGEKLPVAYLDADKDDVFDEGEVTYTTVDAALAAALNSGDLVRMLRNSDETGTFLVVRNGVTLDLNGFQLTASGLSAFNGNHVIDSSETTSGLLVVSRANLILAQDNAELPVWNESNGYFFVTPNTSTASKYQGFDAEYTEGTFKIKFRPGFGFVNGTSADGDSVRTTYLANGGENNGLTMTIRLTWAGTNGPNTQTFTYTDDIFTSAYSQSTGVFFIALAGDVPTVEINVVIVSDTGVEFVGETMTWTASAE